MRTRAPAFVLGLAALAARAPGQQADRVARPEIERLEVPRLDLAPIEAKRAEQKAWLRQRWLDEGLPGTLTFHHVFSGELELMLDHEAMRWGRSLKLGDKVTLQASPPIQAVVKHAANWRLGSVLPSPVLVNKTAWAALDDGVLFELDVTGLPEGTSAVYPRVIPADAPDYMLALAVGDYRRVDLGTSAGGTQLYAWHFPGQETATSTGTRRLISWPSLPTGRSCPGRPVRASARPRPAAR